MRNLVSLICGTLFGAGLYISGMIDPQKVLGFLDIWAIADGGWDPSLAFVMGGGLVVAIPIFWFAKGRSEAVCGGDMNLPANRAITKKLVIGGLLFGTGWGLVGYCPGPALSALAFGQLDTIIFVVAMLAGMAGTRMMRLNG
ncbi:MAG: YeeE/YedE family protein [Rhodospirillales bacterium]|nr:YeeE/YedE family protein [Rhodospirillales bacterium]